uniref:CUB domain-containing protein n=1 Tax=Anopheles coluzzii TaxID=1518534 RepID=A0A8W7P7F9_ANOCL
MIEFGDIGGTTIIRETDLKEPLGLRPQKGAHTTQHTRTRSYINDYFVYKQQSQLLALVRTKRQTRQCCQSLPTPSNVRTSGKAMVSGLVRLCGFRSSMSAADRACAVVLDRLLLVLVLLSPYGCGELGSSQPGLIRMEHEQGPALSASSQLCGGSTLTAPHGIISTPNFPARFPVPISCTWIIDASAIVGANVSIVLYLTQQYVLGGLRFTEYMYYSDDYKVPSMNVYELSEDDVTSVPWIRFGSPYLEVRFTMDSLYGTHLRALDRLLDVYGFNITYEVDTVKPHTCNALRCRFLGNCYAKPDYS